MTGPTPAIRQAARVEVMRLDSVRDMRVAQEWLEAHGLTAVMTEGGVLAGLMSIVGTDGTRMVARLGQWLTYDPESGEFAVYDDDKYREQHAVVEVGLQ